MKLKAIIVDDEIESIKGLIIKLEKACPEVEVVATTTDSTTITKLLHEHEIDILFLDIEMPKLNGFSVLESLKNRMFDVIFVTAHSEYALKAIRANALDYLLKPVVINDLKDAVGKVAERLQGINKTIEQIHQIQELTLLLEETSQVSHKIALKSAKEVFFVNVDEILRIEGTSNYCDFYLLESKRITVTKTLKEFEETLNEFNFFRIHKSHIVNLNFIVRVNKGLEYSVIMSDGAEVKVSHRRRAEFIKALNMS